MQAEDQRHFEPIPVAQANMIKVAKNFEQAKEILKTCPRPTLFVGETVEIKGIFFIVTRIKEDGKVGLKMIPTPIGTKP